MDATLMCKAPDCSEGMDGKHASHLPIVFCSDYIYAIISNAIVLLVLLLGSIMKKSEPVYIKSVLS